jgi:hypothetical protein
MTLKRLVILIIIGMVGIFIGLHYLRRALLAEEDRIAEIVRDIIAAAEEKHVRNIMAHISEDYHDRYGWDKDRVRQTCLYYFFRREKISVFSGSIKVTLSESGNEAEAEFGALFAEGIALKDLKVIPKRSESYRFRVFFRREDGEWKVIGHEHKREPGLDLFGDGGRSDR